MQSNEKEFPKIAIMLIMLFSLIGIIASSVLFVTYYMLHSNSVPLCGILNDSNTGIKINCIDVISSSFGDFYGIPLDFLALVWFSMNLVFLSFLISSKEAFRNKMLYAMIAWSLLGIGVVPYLVYLEIFVIKSICIYCTTMHLALISNFILVLYVYYKLIRKERL